MSEQRSRSIVANIYSSPYTKPKPAKSMDSDVVGSSQRKELDALKATIAILKESMMEKDRKHEREAARWRVEKDDLIKDVVNASRVRSRPDDEPSGSKEARGGL
jgi:hypothetical protein